jgi:hypothetical protein
MALEGNYQRTGAAGMRWSLFINPKVGSQEVELTILALTETELGFRRVASGKGP